MQQLYYNRCVFHNQSATVIKFLVNNNNARLPRLMTPALDEHIVRVAALKKQVGLFDKLVFRASDCTMEGFDLIYVDDDSRTQSPDGKIPPVKKWRRVIIKMSLKKAVLEPERERDEPTDTDCRE